MSLQIKDGNGSILSTPLYVDPTYSAAEGAITAVTSATDQLQMQGAAGIVARIKHFHAVLTPIATGTAGLFQRVDLVRRSTAASGAGGTTNVHTSATARHSLLQSLPGGSVNPAPSVALSRFTGTAPTAGTAAGTLRSDYICQIQMGSTTVAGGAGHDILWDFTVRGDRPCEVNGTADFVCISWNGVTQVTTYSYDIEWEEGLT
jgi:hypothetical protein